MPKPERGTPKDIANRMKAKGLQKLKFYCQMCSKQCRDENGFKCHMTSDSHLRQMKLFSENASGMLDNFSREFESSYLETLRRRHGTKKMNANNVYQEVIQDKHHVHMNSTKWTTLTDFVQYLGKSGKCVVEETERGWYVTYIERDPALLARQEAQRRRVEAEKEEERRVAKQLEVQRVEAAKALDRMGGTAGVVEASEVNLEKKGGGGVAIKLGGAGGKKKAGVAGKVGKKTLVLDAEDEEDEDETLSDQCGKEFGKENEKGGEQKKKRRWGPKEGDGGGESHASADMLKSDHNSMDKKRSADRRDADLQTTKKRKRDREDVDYGDDVRKEHWLRRDILVRIISKKLAKGKYYKRKGVVDRVIDKFTAEVEMLDSGPDERDGGDIIRIDQDDLETVVPKEGKRVRIVNGRGRGQDAEVVSLDKERYRAVLKLKKGGRILEGVDYEDFSKAA